MILSRQDVLEQGNEEKKRTFPALGPQTGQRWRPLILSYFIKKTEEDGSTSTIEEELEESIKKVPKEEDDEDPFLLS